MPRDQALQDFLSRNSAAWQFAWKASDDYLLARFGIRHALWSAFEMATQAAEKLLKSYLLFQDRALAGSADAVHKAVSKKAKASGRSMELGHDVYSALDLAEAQGLSCSTDLRTRILRINSYYDRRYPPATSGFLSAAEVDDVDEAIFELW